MTQGHAECRQNKHNEELAQGYEGTLWMEQCGGGMAQDHVIAIACRNAIRVFKWEDFLYALILLFCYYLQTAVSFIVYEYTLVSSLHTSNPW